MPVADQSQHRPFSVYVVAEDGGVRAALADLPDRTRHDVRLFDTPADFLGAVSDPQGVLLLGMRLDGMSGLALQARLADRPMLKLIFVSAGVTIPEAVAAMKGGAFDFLAGPIRPRAVLDAVAAAMDRLSAERDRRSAGAARGRSLSALTQTEQEIARLMARGLRNGHIARLTSKAENTVKVHRSRILRKLGVDHDYHLRAMIAGASPVDREAAPFA